MKKLLLHTTVCGYNHSEWDIASPLKPGQLLAIWHEKDNPRDPNALMLTCDDIKLGYLWSKDNAAQRGKNYAPVWEAIRNGQKVWAEVTHQLTLNGTYGRLYVDVYTRRAADTLGTDHIQLLS